MIILGTNSIKDTGFDVANSCRFDGSSSSLTKAQGSSPSSNLKATFSMWLKKSDPDADQHFLNVIVDTNNRTFINFTSTSELQIAQKDGGSTSFTLTTNRKFIDVSAWYHIVIAFDTANGTASNRIKVYINGVQETSFATETYPSQNRVVNLLDETPISIGAYNNASHYFDGYMAQVIHVNNQALDATSFGEFDDSGIWKPIDITGLTVETNGYFLDFEDASNLGNDASGGTDFTENNIAATDQSTDTCTNNFATMNPLNIPTSNQPTFSEGNLKTVTSSSGSGRFGGTSTFGVTQGKWYVEAKATISSGLSRNSIGVSYNPAEMARNNSDNTLTDTSYAWGWDSSGGDVYHNSSVVVNYATYATGDICQIFLDLDNHKLYYGKNGSLQSSTGISLDTGETYFIAQIDRTGGSDVSTFEFNFGSPIYAISSSNTDGEYGNFEYSTTITGDGASKTFKALNTKNLAEYG